MQSILRNLRFALRLLAKSPGFTIAVIGTLALGIGANSAIFTVADALLLRPLPYRNPAQLVTVQVKDRSGDQPANLIWYETVRDRATSFQQVSVWAQDNANLTGDKIPVQVQLGRVSPNFFSMLGVNARLGRTFASEEGEPQSKPVVVLSDVFWQSHFHGDPGIVGKVIRLDERAYTVIGVLPAGSEFPFVGPAEVWIPRYFEFSLMPTERLRLGVGYLNIVARLRPDVTLAQANAELEVLNQAYRRQNPTLPDAAPGTTMHAVPLHELVTGDLRGRVALLMAAVGLVLLIACANVASLLLSRALARRREIAVRAALGASRSGIIAQLLTESLLLASIASMLGFALAWGATRALAVWGAAQLPFGLPIQVDSRVLVFTLGIALLSGLLFGLAPALQLARMDLNSVLREEARASSMGRGRSRIKDLLVVGQVALSLLLVISTGLLMRSFARLLRVDPGFDPSNVLTMNISLSNGSYGKPEQQIAFFEEAMRRTAAIPGVRDVAMSAALPLTSIRITPVLPQGQPDVPLAQRPFVDIEAVSAQWFRTMRVPLRAGRAFDSGDQAQSAPVVIANQSFARQFWPGINPVGQHVKIGRRPVPALVVGIAADVKNRGLAQDPQPQLYLPFAQLPWGDMNLVLRTAMPPQSIADAVRAQIAAIDPDQPITKIQTVDDLMNGARTQPRLLLLVVGAFAVTALVLTLVGIYGVLSYSVAERRQEFGIRMALGAERRDILALVLRHGILLALAGVGAGLAAAFALTQVVSSVLYKTSGHDPLTFVAAPILFLLIAVAGSFIPACRATDVNPIETLR